MTDKLWSIVKRQDKFLETLMDAMIEGVIVIDRDSRILMVNDALCRMLEWPFAEVIGQRAEIMMPDPHGRQHQGYIDNHLVTGETKIIGVGREVMAKRRDGSTFPVQLSVGEMRVGDFVMYVGVVRDLSDRRAAEERADFLARYDPLTGVLNRQAFLELGTKKLAELSMKEGEVNALVAFDIDHFRDVNENFGFHIGDLVLKTLAQRLLKVLPKDSLIARVSADEFAVLVRLADGTRSDALGKLVAKSVAQPYTSGNYTVLLSGSIGITVADASIPPTRQPIEELLSQAQMALGIVVRRGGNGVEHYSNEMAESAGERTVLTMQLGNAARNGELYLLYQPLVDARTRRIAGAEALLRWKHPSLGNVSPTRFIPLAEEEGLIGGMTEWILETVADQLVQWDLQGMGPQQVFVNCSAQSFLGGQVSRWVQQIYERTGFPLDRMGIEITEQAAIRKLDAAIKEIEALASLGLQTAIDDFGTGFSSLAYLQRLPVSKLKIDRSFVLDLPSNPKSAAVSQAIIGMAHGLGLSVVAEGVERLEQVDFLREAECDIIQGFFFGRPMSAEDLVGFCGRGSLPLEAFAPPPTGG